MITTVSKTSLVALVCASVAVARCGDDEGSSAPAPAPDASQDASGAADTAAVDDAPATDEASPPEDAGGGEDTAGGEDAGEPDVGPPCGLEATLTLARSSVWMMPGAGAALPFDIERDDVTIPLAVRAAGLPEGVIAPEAALSGEDTSGELGLSAGAEATVGATATATVELVASGDCVVDSREVVVVVSGPPGTPDLACGTDGVSTITVRDPGAESGGEGDSRGMAIGVYPMGSPHAGKIVMAGSAHERGKGNTNKDQFYVARFGPDGALDDTFGEPDGDAKSGYLLVNPGSSWSTYVTDLLIDDAGGVIVLAYALSSPDFYCFVEMFRVTADGELDTEFDDFSGHLAWGSCGDGSGLVRLSGGRFAMIGYWGIKAEHTYHPILHVRSQTTGEYDPDAGGSKTLPSLGGNNTSTRPFGLAADADGNLVAAGHLCNGGFTDDAGGVKLNDCAGVVARMNELGEYDGTFGSLGGGAIYDFTSPSYGGIEAFYAVAVGPDGGIVAVGTDMNNKHATLARFTSDGTPEATFGDAGGLAIDLPEGASKQALVEVLIDESGRLIVVGHTNPPPESGAFAQLVHARFDPGDALDPDWADGGVGTALIDSKSAAGALHPYGRLVLASTVTVDGGNDAGLWCLWR